MSLDIDAELKAVEDNQLLLKALDRYEKQIRNDGLCRESGLGLESLLGGSIPGVDSRKLTVIPSNTNKQLALEAINYKQIISAILGFSLVFTLLIKIFGWLFGESSSGGGGGGYGSGVKEAKKFEEEANAKLDAALAAAEAFVEEGTNHPDRLRKRMIQNTGIYGTVPHTVEVIMDMVTRDDRWNSAQTAIIMARAVTWFKMFPECMDGDRAREEKSLPFYFFIYMLLNPTKNIDFSFCAFMDKVPCMTVKQANEYARLYESGRSHTRQVIPTAKSVLMDKYFRRGDLEEAVEMVGAVEGIVEDSSKLLKIIADNAGQPVEELYDNREFSNIMGRMIKQMYGKESALRHFTGSTAKDQNRIVDMVSAAPDVASPIMTAATLGMAEPDIAYNPPRQPTMFGRTPRSMILWNTTFNLIHRNSFNFNLPDKINKEPDMWATKLEQIAPLIQYCLRDAPRQQLENAIEAGNSRDLRKFNQDCGRVAERVKRRAEEAKKVADHLVKVEQRTMIDPDKMVKGDFMRAIRMFLESTVISSKDLVTYCRNIDIAQNSVQNLEAVLRIPDV